MAGTLFEHLRGNNSVDTNSRLMQQAYGSDFRHSQRTNNRLNLYTDAAPDFRPLLAAVEFDEVEKVENPIEDKLSK
jgi:hypothetical protein